MPTCLTAVGPAEVSLKLFDPLTRDYDQRATKLFQFDRVFSEDAGQRDIFGDVSDLVKAVIDGDSVCIFAYGQTGAGKTYTMEGNSMSSHVISNKALPSDDHLVHDGIITRAVR